MALATALEYGVGRRWLRQHPDAAREGLPPPPQADTPPV
jgi:hypothetical protein